MLRWIACPYQRPLRVRRSIVFPVLLFMITTGLLYALVERTTLTPTDLESSSSPSSVSESLSSTWTCELNNETIRAIHLAPSEHCKNKLKETACQINSIPDFYPKSLPRLCPVSKGRFGDVIGCVSSDNSTRYIDEVQTFTTANLCVDHCLKHSVSFAEHNQWTGQCSCLLSFDNQSERLLSDRPCTEWRPSNDVLSQPLRTLYRTGYVDFGNHLEKNREKVNNTQLTIVFFLTVGGRRNLRQIKRLVRAIYSRQHYYLIHVDRRENYLHQELVKLAEHVPNIHLTSKRYSTTWGASALLTAHLEAFREIFDQLKWNFSFILNLSESDFPLKPVQVLTNFLSMYTSYNFLRTHNREPFKFIKSQGMFHTFVHCNDYMYRIGSRSLIQNIVYDGGSDWYVLNRQFVHYVTYGDDELVNGLRHTFNYSLLPCEAFFHTVLSNSIYCDTYIRSNFRLVHWNRERGCKCQHKHVVDWCGCSPLVYRNADKTILNDTIDKPLFFARKFDPTIDETIIDWLDEKISRRDLSTGALYLQNIYHLTDGTTGMNSVLKLLDAYARTMLIEYQDSRRRCFGDDDTLQLEQIHSIYQMSTFQGYSFGYQFNDQERLEVLINLNSFEATRAKDVKRFEIGLELDSKELIFLDRSRTFIEPKLVKVLVQWESARDNDTSLRIQSPNGTVLQHIRLHSSNEPFVLDIAFPVISSPSLIGTWQMSIVQDHTALILASLNFLLLLSNENQWLNIQYLTILSNFWSISDMCSTMSNRSSCLEESNGTLSTVKNCSEQRWSFFFFDVKSDW